jgi:hypothetical protein
VAAFLFQGDQDQIKKCWQLDPSVPNERKWCHYHRFETEEQAELGKNWFCQFFFIKKTALTNLNHLTPH